MDIDRQSKKVSVEMQICAMWRCVDSRGSYFSFFSFHTQVPAPCLQPAAHSPSYQSPLLHTYLRNISTYLHNISIYIYTIYLQHQHAPAGPLLLVAAVFPLVLAAARLAGVLAAPLPHPLHPVALVPDQRKYFSRIFKIFFCGRTCPRSATS